MDSINKIPSPIASPHSLSIRFFFKYIYRLESSLYISSALQWDQKETANESSFGIKDEREGLSRSVSFRVTPKVLFSGRKEERERERECLDPGGPSSERSRKGGGPAEGPSTEKSVGLRVERSVGKDKVCLLYQSVVATFDVDRSIG